MPETSLPSFVEWSSFPFEGVLRVKKPEEPVDVEPPRLGEDAADCPKCHAPDEVYIWVNENWRVRSMDRPSGLPMVLILESRSHLDLGDLPNMLAAELGVMTVRLERAVRSIDGVARVHVNRWGDGAAHLHVWFMARPYGRLQLRGTFLTLWDEIMPPIPEHQWRENLALVAAWLAEFGGEPLAKPPRIDWKAPASFAQMVADSAASATVANGEPDPPSVGAAPADTAPATAPPANPQPAPPPSSAEPIARPEPASRAAPPARPEPTNPARPPARPESASRGAPPARSEPSRSGPAAAGAESTAPANPARPPAADVVGRIPVQPSRVDHPVRGAEPGTRQPSSGDH